MNPNRHQSSDYLLLGAANTAALACRARGLPVEDDVPGRAVQRVLRAKLPFEVGRARMAKIVEWIARDDLRTRSRRLGLLKSGISEQSPSDAGDEDAKFLAERTTELLEFLTPHEQEVLRLRIGFGHTLKEVANALQVPLSTANDRIASALSALEELIDRDPELRACIRRRAVKRRANEPSSQRVAKMDRSSLAPGAGRKKSASNPSSRSP